jgi:hypothetical protein
MENIDHIILVVPGIVNGVELKMNSALRRQRPEVALALVVAATMTTWRQSDHHHGEHATPLVWCEAAQTASSIITLLISEDRNVKDRTGLKSLVDSSPRSLLAPIGILEFLFPFPEEC